MSALMELAERGILPDALIRLGIRMLDRMRLRVEARPDCESTLRAKQEFLAGMHRSPVAPVPEMANRQHYEVPPEFFQLVLGRHLKYSGCWWPAGVRSLDAAEEAMLALYGRRAELADGLQILELGCGWGALTLWMAARAFRAAASRPFPTRRPRAGSSASGRPPAGWPTSRS